jgi:hypothetical protein
MDNIYSTGVLWGLDAYHLTNNPTNEYSPTSELHDNLTQKAIKNLAGTCGLNIQNGISEETINELEKISGISLECNFYPNRLVMIIGNKKVSCRHVTSVQCVYKLKPYIKQAPTDIFEIGAGCGYISRIFMNMYPAAKYHILDLPTVSVIQSYIYAATANEQDVWFYGEPQTPNSRLHIYHSDSDIDVPFDFVVNHNSFTEIPAESQQKYLKMIKKNLKSGGFFGSVNHEMCVSSGHIPTTTACLSGGFKPIVKEPFNGDFEWEAGPSPYLFEIFEPQ